jgi:hypothetical protein
MERTIEQIKEYVSKYFDDPEPYEYGPYEKLDIPYSVGIHGMRTDYDRDVPDFDDSNDDDTIELGSQECETEDDAWREAEKFVDSVKAKRIVTSIHGAELFCHEDRKSQYGNESYAVMIGRKVVGRGHRTFGPNKSFKCPWLDALNNLGIVLDECPDL